jgi:hypothetical protein
MRDPLYEQAEKWMLREINAANIFAVISVVPVADLNWGRPTAALRKSRFREIKLAILCDRVHYQLRNPTLAFPQGNALRL